MTNETTASQPKSIGDDAQFRARLADLYSAYDESIELGISEPNDRAVSKLIAVIDNFCAPAAQASSTIQAAPETCTGCDNPAGPQAANSHGFCNDCIEFSGSTPAAAIQEPVMVAEPVGARILDALLPESEKVLHRVIDSLQKKLISIQVSRNEWMKIANTQGDLHAAEQLAAPMVADPAGVVLQARSPLGDPWQEVDADNFYKAQANGYETRVLHLAATVKAVPSEALEYRTCCDHSDCTTCAGRGGFYRAAPLADKTGGGE